MLVKWKNKSLILLLFGLLLATASCKKETATEHKEHATETEEGVIYTCPMHPEVTSDKPGRCPECNMFLEPKDVVLEQLIADPNRIVVSSQATVQAKSNTMNKQVQAEGIIAFDERQNNTVAAYFPGRIEELFVKYNYTFVRKGQPILSLYSPELLTAQQEFLFVLHAEDNALAEQARKRLRLLGLTESQLKTLEKTGKPQTKTTVYSPYEGFVRFTPEAATTSTTTQSPAAAGGSMGNMGAANTAPDAPVTQSTSVENPIREGQYVAKGQTLFQVNDLKKVWAILTLPAGIAGSVETGDKVTIRSQLLPDKTILGEVNFIESVVRQGQNQVTVRVYLANPDLKLKPNSLVQATIADENKQAVLTVPTSAVWSLGRRNIVWVRKTPAGNHSFSFEATEVQIGKQNGDYTEIISGLPDGAHVAKEAGYMTDSESFIRP
ncbi:efflux RND transporter periplasmic adaptor subunit [Adhaeribacter sp. BT258]|uniref:Efflux RND transporter periplasmic adaptor subunit n=1 Tax=Adhaeribacter terrigena TaxID=2793070 RepID=A0ABS1BY80_9BACT|nr:efflux RND transporter periplasmic adaptor subunit [Adhaeribacter terrigena]MBK0401857.1 efflux RND transporter periplasmic adaptor subunit [Adhaeribacter terrigena]